jgi:hypothetical protein
MGMMFMLLRVPAGGFMSSKLAGKALSTILDLGSSLDYVDTQILSSLKDNTWHSVRTHAQELYNLASTVQRHLRKSLCFSPRHYH